MSFIQRNVASAYGRTPSDLASMVQGRHRQSFLRNRTLQASVRLWLWQSRLRSGSWLLGRACYEAPRRFCYSRKYALRWKICILPSFDIQEESFATRPGHLMNWNTNCDFPIGEVLKDIFLKCIKLNEIYTLRCMVTRSSKSQPWWLYSLRSAVKQRWSGARKTNQDCCA